MTTASPTSAGKNVHHHAHHFDSAEHEYSASKEGIWLFLVTEIMMFGGLFVAFAIFKNIWPATFSEGSKFLNTTLGTINTIVLISSSLTMALAIHYIQVNKKNAAMLNLVITILCAITFMVIKYFEYTHKIREGILPGTMFRYEETEITNMGLFFGLYYVMTGIHGLHVLIGIGLIVWILIRMSRDEFSPTYYTAVEGVGLFWHVVDLIWIFLFPLYYLMH